MTKKEKKEIITLLRICHSYIRYALKYEIPEIKGVYLDLMRELTGKKITLRTPAWAIRF